MVIPSLPNILVLRQLAVTIRSLCTLVTGVLRKDLISVVYRHITILISIFDSWLTPVLVTDNMSKKWSTISNLLFWIMDFIFKQVSVRLVVYIFVSLCDILVLLMCSNLKFYRALCIVYHVSRSTTSAFKLGNCTAHFVYFLSYVAKSTTLAVGSDSLVHEQSPRIRV